MTEYITSVEKLITAIQQKSAVRRKPIIVAIDGRSGTGKSTLANAVASRLDATILVCDDFYSGGDDSEWLAYSPQQRVAKCIDWQRIRTEVLEPLLNGKRAIYRPFDFKVGKGLAANTIAVMPAPFIILEGAYSARPELADVIDFKILVEFPDEARRQRLIQREGNSFMQTWHTIWDAAEDYYFEQVRPPSSFDFVIA
jgi:uridine kinase